VGKCRWSKSARVEWSKTGVWNSRTVGIVGGNHAVWAEIRRCVVKGARAHEMVGSAAVSTAGHCDSWTLRLDVLLGFISRSAMDLDSFFAKSVGVRDAERFSFSSKCC